MTTRSQQAVAVEVGCGDAHAGDGLAVAVAGDTRVLADLLEPEVALVGEQPAGRAVVGDIDVRSIVTGQLGDQDAQSAAVRGLIPAVFGYIGECPIAVVAVKPIGLRRKVLGAAIVAAAVRGRAVGSGFRVNNRGSSRRTGRDRRRRPGRRTRRTCSRGPISSPPARSRPRTGSCPCCDRAADRASR